MSEFLLGVVVGIVLLFAFAALVTSFNAREEYPVPRPDFNAGSPGYGREFGESNSKYY